MAEPVINISALEPLYKPWEVPTHHRVRAPKDGDSAQVIKGRRPTPVEIAQNLRQAVAEWRDADYASASDTTRELLYHWFDRSHLVKTSEGHQAPFHYYFCQREAIETLIYLMEVRSLTSLSAVTAEFGGENRELAALGINPEEDLWPRYAFKVATGAGKTKIMSLVVVWSYFHALRESDSPMARHFVVIAPNLTVFERLKVDFGNGIIFDADPLIPAGWRGDWNLSVVLQDEASGASTGGTLYLTNIHRLYDIAGRKKKDTETYEWMGPTVSKAKALDTGEALRERITSNSRVMVLNDEAHHVWDPDSAWNEAITYLNKTISQRTGGGLCAQLDFSATPKDNKGQLLKHIVCDAPLGEAVDAGIVKTPIIGRGGQLVQRADDNAAYKYENHLTLGYQRWLESKKEWEKSGKKALLFVMTENTKAADQIVQRLNSDSIYSELNGKTINLHTNLKGKLKKRGKGQNTYYEFLEDEKEISDQDLKELRKLSRELDDNTSPYLCIVSVLMLREGWDVRNVTTIVPLRPLSAQAKILPEQTLGRGLRRMTPPGEAAEIVSVIEHSAFVSLYRNELSQEGLPIEVVDVEKVPRTTVTIYPDEVKKDLKALDLLIPQLSSGYRIVPALDDLSFYEIKQAFARFKLLPLGEPTNAEINYEGRHLLTNEIIEQMRIRLPLLENGFGAISFYREELERLTNLRGFHSKLAPLLQKFLEEVLFVEKTTLVDPRLVCRLADADVREHIRATFVPLIRQKTIKSTQRTSEEVAASVCQWRPFQVTHSERHPTKTASKTPFNLVPCNRELEVAMAHFADHAPDMASFCKNAGPQALRIDYLAVGGRPALYTPDFMMRKTDGSYLLVETKGREDKDVPGKARAAVAWCKAASTKQVKWDYLYVPQGIFSGITGNKIADLARTCAPTLTDLLTEATGAQVGLPLFERGSDQVEAEVAEFIDPATLEKLPSRYRRAVEQSITLFHFLEKKESASYAPVLSPLLGPLDEAARGLILERLLPELPAVAAEQKVYFEPYYSGLKEKEMNWLREKATNLKRTLVYTNGLMPLGLLEFCLDYAQRKTPSQGGVFGVIRSRFGKFNNTDLLNAVKGIYTFRNNYVAHQNQELTDSSQCKEALRAWISGLRQIYAAHHE